MNSNQIKVIAATTAGAIALTTGCGMRLKPEYIRQRDIVKDIDKQELIGEIYSDKKDELNNKLFELENAILKYRYLDGKGLGYMVKKSSDIDKIAKDELDIYTLDAIIDLYNESIQTKNDDLDKKLIYVYNSSRAIINDNLETLKNVLYRDAKLKIGEEINKSLGFEYVNSSNYDSVVQIGKNQQEKANTYKVIVIGSNGLYEYTIPKGNNAAYNMIKMGDKINKAIEDKDDTDFKKKLRLERLGLTVLKTSDVSEITIDSNHIITTSSTKEAKDYLEDKYGREFSK